MNLMKGTIEDNKKNCKGLCFFQCAPQVCSPLARESVCMCVCGAKAGSEQEWALCSASTDAQTDTHAHTLTVIMQAAQTSKMGQ